MTKLPFRTHHALEVLTHFDPRRGPIDRFIHLYFRANKALGSKDRKEVAEMVYRVIRWKRLLTHLAGADQWEAILDVAATVDLHSASRDRSIPPAVRLSCPDLLWEMLCADYDEAVAEDILRANNSAAPTYVRANRQKISRDALMELWRDEFVIAPCVHAADGIRFIEKKPLFGTSQFQEGLFEVQDEGSQLLAALVDVSPGEQVLDFCAGAGGKALAIAPAMEGKGQLFLHDIRGEALIEARRRMKRAGVQNGQIIYANAPQLKKLKKKMDWILVDAPCTGTGTFRRNPDMKWRFTDALVSEIVGMQRTIFERALSYLTPGGKIVYATCSILKKENEQQVERFTELYGLEVVNTFSSIPAEGEMDGFFGAVLKKNSQQQSTQPTEGNNHV